MWRVRPSGEANQGLIHFVVEIPAGTNAKWEVDKATGGLHWEQKDGRPRVVQYLAYPGNYGMIPSTSLPYEIGGDGEPGAPAQLEVVHEALVRNWPTLVDWLDEERHALRNLHKMSAAAEIWHNTGKGDEFQLTDALDWLADADWDLLVAETDPYHSEPWDLAT